MSRLLWFVLGGIATAVGAGVAALVTEESEENSLDEPDEGQESTSLDCEGPEASSETGK